MANETYRYPTHGAIDCGYANQQQNQTLQQGKPMSILESQVVRLSASAAVVEGLAIRLHKVADQLFGPVTQSAGEAGAPAAPAAAYSLGKLREAHDWHDRALTSLRAAVERLEAL